jgi:RNA polymerase sigma factor (sigma-70 family)
MSNAHLSSAARQLQHLVALATAESLPDAVLLERFVRRRDEDAFAALVRRHGPMILRVCRRVVGCDAQAADCFQATFVVLVRRAASIRDTATLANWLYGVANRVARDARARMQREAGNQAPERPAPTADPCQQAAWRELGAIIEEEVGALPDKLRLPILLCYWQGLTNVEAAAPAWLARGHSQDAADQGARPAARAAGAAWCDVACGRDHPLAHASRR